MLGLLVDVVSNFAAANIVSYQSGLFEVDMRSIRNYVDTRMDYILARKR